METVPSFPDFKPLELGDRDFIHERLWRYQPRTSELTFVNLYVWRSYYHFQWCMYDDHLLLLAAHPERGYLLPPVGRVGRRDIVRAALEWMGAERGVSDPCVARAGADLAEELGEDAAFSVLLTRDHFDYVYLSEDLGTLSGRRYSKKRNHINQFLRSYAYQYAPLTVDLVQGCLDLAEVWCEQRACEDDISLTHEFCGIRDALQNLEALHLEGGVLLIDGRVQAFALGELLNAETAVVHIEKANPEYHGIYPMMTKGFSEQRWMGQVKYINREQDVGDPGLRHAKESYYPDHLVEKFEIRLES